MDKKLNKLILFFSVLVIILFIFKCYLNLYLVNSASLEYSNKLEYNNHITSYVEIVEENTINNNKVYKLKDIYSDIVLPNNFSITSNENIKIGDQLEIETNLLQGNINTDYINIDNAKKIIKQ